MTLEDNMFSVCAYKRFQLIVYGKNPVFDHLPLSMFSFPQNTRTKKLFMSLIQGKDGRDGRDGRIGVKVGEKKKRTTIFHNPEQAKKKKKKEKKKSSPSE